MTAEGATVADLWRELAAELSPTTPTASLDARLIVAHVLGWSADEVLFRDGQTAGPVAVIRARNLVRRRAAGEPVARILGAKEFYGLPLALSADTLIPRPDTEALVDAVLAVVDRETTLTILDLGTGSGAILLALLSQLPNASGLGVDIAEGAVVTARGNARALGLADRAEFGLRDWTSGIDGKFNVIVANPPYVRRAEIPRLPIEVREHDPHLALDGGLDGLDAVRTILADLGRVLADGGVAFIEIGFGQAAAVATLAGERGFDAGFRRDLAGIERVAILSRRRDRNWLVG